MTVKNRQMHLNEVVVTEQSRRDALHCTQLVLLTVCFWPMSQLTAPQLRLHHSHHFDPKHSFCTSVQNTVP